VVTPRPPTETIAAIATGPAAGAIGMVRLSGPQASAIATQITGKTLPPPRQAGLRQFLAADGAALDSGLVLVFPAPHSFTGEDIVELQGHGGRVVLAEVLAACVAAGARLARPGEFSERAFLNGRLDLSQAEAIADLIAAQSGAAVRAAQQTLNGAFSQLVHEAVAQLVEARVWIEGALDFSDEDVDWLADARLHQRLQATAELLQQTLGRAQQGARLRDGLSVAILGAPNVGKSTLLNQLAGYEAAIVSPIAGTTRDLVREQIQLDGLTLHLVDTAGLRSTEDTVEAEGIRRGLAAAERAELILYVADSTLGLTEFDIQQLAQLGERTVLLLLNKCDLAPTEAIQARLPDGVRQVLPMAAKSGAGIGALVAALKAQAGIAAIGEGAFLARARHIEGLQQALAHLQSAQARLAERALPELAAEELRLAQLAMSRITGDFGSEDLLGAIFSRFCIGK